MEMAETELTATKRPAWNAGRTVGAKRALKPKQIWEIRFYLNQCRRLRDRALFDLAIDSKLRGCDLVQIKICNLVSGGTLITLGGQSGGHVISTRKVRPTVSWPPCRGFDRLAAANGDEAKAASGHYECKYHHEVRIHQQNPSNRQVPVCA
jgi:hypothetical protein